MFTGTLAPTVAGLPSQQPQGWISWISGLFTTAVATASSGSVIIGFFAGIAAEELDCGNTLDSGLIDSHILDTSDYEM